MMLSPHIAGSSPVRIPALKVKVSATDPFVFTALAADVQKALAECRRLARDEGVAAALSRYELDAIVTPSGEPAWLTDWVNGDHHESSSWSPAAVAGYPSITVPAGYVFGLPVNISLIGGAWQEGKLIRLAYAFEQAMQVRRPPQFLPSVDYDRPV